MAVQKPILKTFKLSELNPATYNPRKALKPGDPQFEKLKNSIENFGYVEMIVVNVANNNTVISGHQRLSVLQHLGETEAECVCVEMNEKDEKALNIAMNKVVGEWDLPKLADLMLDLEQQDYNLEVTGFDLPEIDEIMSNIYDKNVKDDDKDFDIDEAYEAPNFTKPGDLWILGKHKVLCGDSTLQESFDRLLDGEKVNMVLSDLPYFVSYKGTAGTIKNDDLDDKEALEFTLKTMQCMYDAMADDASIYIFHSDSKGLIFRTAFERVGFYLSGCCIWKKQSLVLGRSPYQWIHEPVLFGWKKKGKHCWYSDRKQTTVWEYDKPTSSKFHPTCKPIPLMSYPIKNSTMTNGIVLDPFLGSGSTLIACCETDRICRGIELDTKYMDVIVQRYCAYKGGFDDVYVLRDGKKMSLEETLKDSDEPIDIEQFWSTIQNMKGA